MSEVYSARTSLIAGKLSRRKRLAFRSIISKSDYRTIGLFSLFLFLALASTLYLLVASSVGSTSLWVVLVILLIATTETIRFIQAMTLAVFASFAKDPIPMQAKRGLRVAVLTTIVPGKEPLDLVADTLRAMKQIQPGPGNTLDVWLLDEGNDRSVRALCSQLGVHHFSRKGVAKWNTASGAHKAKTKHGNHNAWRSVHENSYDVVAQMDPDHLPRKNFLTRTLGYFNDPTVAFVVAPQVYGNIRHSWLAHASAFQAYIFHGIIQRGGNGLSAPLLIGTNHLYRTSAFKEINGYQDSIIEDHLTSMVIYSTHDAYGRRLQGVYTPDILAVGEGPTSYTDYFNQQKRWAYGIWEILLHSTPRIVRGMRKRQALSFLMLQFFYPSVAVSWVASTVLAVVLCFLPLSLGSSAGPIAILWLASFTVGLGLFFWLRKFNLVSHERRDWGVEGMGLLLMCIPVYVNAAYQALLRRPLTYAVTAKGSLTSPDSWATFSSHINWAAINGVVLMIIMISSTSIDRANVAWTVERILVCLMPLALFAMRKVPVATMLRLLHGLSVLKPATKVLPRE